VDPALRIFRLGVAGSAAVEVLILVKVYEAGWRLPARYKRWGYLLARAALAALAGLLAMAYGIQNDILAIHIGATAPALLGTLIQRPPEIGAEGLPPPGPGGKGPSAAGS
jgi:hypothetical protein